MTEKSTLRAVLACKMQPNDADASTVGEYLTILTQAVWCEKEGFDGKRPFGNSSWEYEVINSLAQEGIVEAYDLVLEALQAAELVIP